MFRVSRSRFLVAVLFLVLVSPVAFLTTQPTAGAQPATRPSRESQSRPAAELPLFSSEPAAPPDTARATTMPELPWSRIVYFDRNSDKWDIYLITDDGQNRQQLTNTKAAEIDPDLSRGGGTVVYASNADGDFELYAMSAQGAGAHPLTSNSKDDAQPRFAPDNSRIVFVSERDGQAEVYTMKPDGSDQKRLTFNSDYDGDPAWSPDGKQIAFSSRRNGVYRIWVMNADGSDQRQLSDTPYSVAPVWSPNGEQIVFSAEGDSDGWLDLMLMNADGGDEHKIHNASGPADAIARSWSPDGNQVAFTKWNYVPYQGQWYIGSTFLMRLKPGDVHASSITNLPQYPFAPAWQSLDAQAPQSSLAALPAQSPAEVTVSWSGTDSGGSGLRVFDVQVRLNDGEWTLWQKGTGETSAVYAGTSGQRLAFRVRARDYATNFESWPAGPQAVTTIETLPPRSAVLPLPPYTRAGEPFTVAWDGLDPGGSGIAGFTVQYRIASGAWMTLLADTLEGSVAFSPESKGVAPGQTVAFRVRAIDKAQNLEAWPQESGDTATTLYTWTAAGHITDNTGVPIGGASVMTTPDTIHPTTSGMEGDYRAYGKDAVASVLLTWAKPGYGSLPQSLFAADKAAQVDAVMPPADDVIGNGSFEGAWPGDVWSAGGTLPIAQTSGNVGSGTAALQFSEEGKPFAAREKVTPATKALAGSQRLFLAGATPLALWNTYQDGLIEATRTSDGWTAPRQVVPMRVAAYAAAGDNQGQVHVVAQVLDLSPQSDQLYLRRSVTGEWTEPELLPNTPYGTPLALAITPDGRVHLQGRDEFFSLLYYQVRTNAGWAPSEAVNPPGTAVDDSAFAVTPNGTVTVAWVRRATGDLPLAILARTRQQNGSWSAVTNVHQDSAPAQLQLGELLPDALGRLHLAWVQRYGEDSTLADLYYVQRTGAGWGQPYKVSDSVPLAAIRDTVLSTAGEPRVAVTSMGTDNPGSVLFSRNPDGTWQAPQTIAGAGSQAIHLLVDPVDRTYIALAVGNQIGYRWREPSGDFSPIWWLGGEKIIWAPELALDAADRTHLLYNLNAPNPNGSVVESDVFYHVSQVAATPGEAWVSQTVTVTEAMEHPVLSLRYSYSGMTTEQSGFTAEIDGDAHPLAVTEGLTHAWLDLSAYRGRTVPVTFRLRQAANDAAGWAILDDVSLGSAHTDVWVEGLAAAAALPGQTVELLIQVGNRAGIIADSAKLELSLPPELAFVSAAPSPSGQAPLRWELGTLAAESDATIVVTARVAAGAKPFSTVKATATVSAEDELETLNNTADVVVRVRRELYLPGVAAP